MRRLLFHARPLILMELHGPESQNSLGALIGSGYRICRMERYFPGVLPDALG
jgi:hypothetical protein